MYEGVRNAIDNDRSAQEIGAKQNGKVNIVIIDDCQRKWK